MILRERKDALRPRFAGGGYAASVSSLSLDNFLFNAERDIQGTEIGARKRRTSAQPRNRRPPIVLRFGVASLLGKLASLDFFRPRGAGGKASTWVVCGYARTHTECAQ